MARRNASNLIFWGSQKAPLAERKEIGSENGHSTSVAVADFNLDGNLDIVFSSRRGAPELHIRQSEKFFSSNVVANIDADVRGVVAADFDNSGSPDLALSVIGGQNIVLSNNDDGQFRECTKLGDMSSDSYAIAAADLDLDGDTDLVVGNDSVPSVIYWNTGLGNCAFISEIIDMEPAGVYAVSIGDLNGDRYPEIVFSNSDKPNFILLNREK